MELTSLIASLPAEIHVLVVAALPLIELRGAIPIGMALGMTAGKALLLSMIGSSLPAPFILLLIQPLMDRMKRSRWLSPLENRLRSRYTSPEKTEKLQRYGALGLALFVGVPLPGTGVWSGCLVAALFGMPFRLALPAVIIGNLLAGLIVTVISGSAFWLIRR